MLGRFRSLTERDDVAKYVLGGVLWLGLWGGLNTGPWAVQGIGTGFVESFHGLRVFAPLTVILLAAVLLPGRHDLSLRRPTAAETLWILYGVCGIGAGLAWRAPGSSLYWGAAYLSGFAVVEFWLFGSAGDDIGAGGRLNKVTWILTGLVLTALVVAAGDAFLAKRAAGWSAYGVVHRVGEQIGGMAMSRASGLGRMAAVVGLVLFPVIWERTGWKRYLSLLGFLAATVLLVLLTSRGAIGAFLVGLLVVSLSIVRGRVSFAALLSGITILIVLAGLGLLLGLFDPVFGYLSRGTQGILELSGRGNLWRESLSVWKERPVLGYGFQADRRLIGRTAHGGLFYALVTAGAIGAAAYVAGLAVTWYRFAALFRSHWNRLAPGTQLTMVQVVGVIGALTARHYPENTATLFSVDYLIMLPAVAYVGSVYRSVRDSSSSSVGVPGGA